MCAAVLVGSVAVSGIADAKIRVPLISPPLQVAHHTTHIGDWRLAVETGKFSRDIRCRLRAKRMVYVPDAIGFRFGSGLDTTDAWFSVDGGEPSRWRDVLPELVRLGVAIDGPNLDAPTGGVVWIPAALVEDATTVRIQPRPDRKPRVFRLHGFAGLREIARAKGCEPESRFVG